jgi:hypothetical protein
MRINIFTKKYVYERERVLSTYYIIEKTVHRQIHQGKSSNQKTCPKKKKKKAKRYIKDVLPKKWWNGTNYSANPCIDWVDLLQGSIYKCIKNQIGCCQPSCQHISLRQPCHRSSNISLSAHRLMRQEFII